MSHDRSLRFLNVLATAIAIPLNIAATVLSTTHERREWYGRSVTTFGFVFMPLASTLATSLISLQYQKKHGKSPSGGIFIALDLLSVLFYISVLVPCWVVEVQSFDAGGFGLLVGYLTTPMIINLFIHSYFTLKNVPYKKLLSVFGKRNSSCQQCPNCQAKFIPGTIPTKENYSLLRGEDYLDVEADPIQYRDSEDFLGEGAERAEQAEQSKQSEDSGKGKDMMDV